MFELPTTVAEIDQLILDGVQESLHLDYKGSAAIDNGKRNEITKDVSAFANSDGGLIIYGVEEKDNIPVKKDDGVDHTKYKREWLEQVIQSNIGPRIDDLHIAQIPLSSDRSIYAIKIPKSFRGPHQAMDKKYYKRFNFQSVAMEDYEISDSRNRRQVLLPLLNVDIEIEHSTVVFIVVSNIGSLPAQEVSFDFSEKLIWQGEDGAPGLFTRGAKYFPPKRSYRFFYHSFNEAVSDETEIPYKFDVTANYLHPKIGQRISDIFHIDIKDYWNSSPSESEIYEHAATLKESIEKLTSAVNNLNKNISLMTSIAGPTGLDLSVTTLRNLRHFINGESQLEKMHASECGYKVFMEVLGIDYKMAHQLRIFFNTRNQSKKLIDIDGMTGELIEKIKEYFYIIENSI